MALKDVYLPRSVRNLCPDSLPMVDILTMVFSAGVVVAVVTLMVHEPMLLAAGMASLMGLLFLLLPLFVSMAPFLGGLLFISGVAGLTYGALNTRTWYIDLQSRRALVRQRRVARQQARGREDEVSLTPSVPGAGRDDEDEGRWSIVDPLTLDGDPLARSPLEDEAPLPGSREAALARLSRRLPRGERPLRPWRMPGEEVEPILPGAPQAVQFHVLSTPAPVPSAGPVDQAPQAFQFQAAPYPAGPLPPTQVAPVAPAPAASQQVFAPAPAASQQVFAPAPAASQQVFAPAPAASQQVFAPAPAASQQVFAMYAVPAQPQNRGAERMERVKAETRVPRHHQGRNGGAAVRHPVPPAPVVQPVPVVPAPVAQAPVAQAPVAPTPVAFAPVPAPAPAFVPTPAPGPGMVGEEALPPVPQGQGSRNYLSRLARPRGV